MTCDLQEYCPNFFKQFSDFLNENDIVPESLKYHKSGFTSLVFLIEGNEQQIVKITNLDTVRSEGIGERPDTPSVLQPIKSAIYGGDLYEIAIYKKLNTKDVTDRHVELLKAKLREEGYSLNDDKKENIGLDEDENPFVIDGDAVVPLKIDDTVTDDKSLTPKL